MWKNLENWESDRAADVDDAAAAGRDDREARAEEKEDRDDDIGKTKSVSFEGNSNPSRSPKASLRKTFDMLKKIK